MTHIPFDPNAAAMENGGVFGLPNTLRDSCVVLLPVPVEITTSYGGGTAKGPDAILKASRQVDLYDVTAGRVYEAGIYMMKELPVLHQLNREGRVLARQIIRRGGRIGSSVRLKKALDRVNKIGDEINRIVYRETRKLLVAGKIVGVVGGDHSTPFGAIRALADRYPGMGILHFDAHCDLRIAYEGFKWSHASIMYNVVTEIGGISRLVQVGIRDFCEQELGVVRRSRGRIQTFFDEELKRELLGGRSWKSLVSRVVHKLPRRVYISFDIDGLNPSLCPHTGTPVPGGLSFEEAVYVFRALVESGREIVGFDLNEVTPGPEEDEWDANVASRLIYKLIGHTMLSQKKK